MELVNAEETLPNRDVAGIGAFCRGAAVVDFTKFAANPNASKGR